jgi:hypothetical protein
LALALACDTGIGTMVISIGTMVTSTCQRDTAITMTIATTTIATIAAKIIQSLPPTHRSEQFDTELGSAGR